MNCIHDPWRPSLHRHGSGSPRVTAATLTLAAVSVVGFYSLMAYGNAVPLVLAIAASWSTRTLVRALDR